MADFFEVLMIVCFGFSWPFNIMKLYKSRTAKNTSVQFYFLIWIGYIFGLISKGMKVSAGGHVAGYVWFFYCLNTLMLTIGIILYYRNKKLDMEAA